MNILDLTNGRTSYEIHFTHSTLIECALGIAIITYPELYPTLEKPDGYWQRIRSQLSPSLRDELDYCEQNNTWKTLLQLLHQQDFADVRAFTCYLQDLPDEQLRFLALPYIGGAHQENRHKASQGEAAAIQNLVAATRNHKFYPSYIPYIAEVELSTLRRHLCALIQQWHDEYLVVHEPSIEDILARDIAEKKDLVTQFAPEDFVKWATGGVAYQAEPTVPHVLLVPHYTYRPWTIQADMEGTKILYYPVSDHSIDSELDVYRPSLALVQRYKALGDETRLRILKLLYEQDRTLHELTEILGMAKSTIHHHLALLKAAQLVEGKDHLYVLSDSVLACADAEIRHYLKRGSAHESR